MFLNKDVSLLYLFFFFLNKKGNMEAQLHTAEIAVVDIDEKIHQAHSSVLP